MKYFRIQPEVAGGWGQHTVADRSVHPPIVSHLHYEFLGWLGDAILTTFPCYIVTAEAAEALGKSGVTGARFVDVEISTDYPFEELYPGRDLPPFVWLQVHGRAGVDDFGIAPVNRLVMSETALRTLAPYGIEHAIIEPFDQADDIAR